MVCGAPFNKKMVYCATNMIQTMCQVFCYIEWYRFKIGDQFTIFFLFKLISHLPLDNIDITLPTYQTQVAATNLCCFVTIHHYGLTIGATSDNILGRVVFFLVVNKTSSESNSPCLSRFPLGSEVLAWDSH